jgi:tetratricopeptide (TPR) repeat protein
MGQNNEAIADFNKSISLKSSPQALINRGVVYIDMQNYEDAIKDFNNVITNFSKEIGEVYYYRGVAYKALKKTPLACLDFNKSMQLGYRLASQGISDCK